MRRVLGIWVVLSALILAGCGGDEAPAQEPTPKPATPPKARVKPKVAKTSAAKPPQGEKVSVELWANGRVRVRRGPDRSFEIARLTEDNEHLWAVEKRNGWYRLEGKRSLWIYKSVVRLTEARPEATDAPAPVESEEERVEADNSFAQGAKRKEEEPKQEAKPTPAQAPAAREFVLHVQGSRYYHSKDDCPSKEAPTARRLTPSEAKAKGLRECRACSKR